MLPRLFHWPRCCHGRCYCLRRLVRDARVSPRRLFDIPRAVGARAGNVQHLLWSSGRESWERKRVMAQASAARPESESGKGLFTLCANRFVHALLCPRMGCADCGLPFCNGCASTHECFFEDSEPSVAHNNSCLRRSESTAERTRAKIQDGVTDTQSPRLN